MSAARPAAIKWLVVAALAVLLAIGLAAAMHAQKSGEARADSLRLGLMSSLPLLWGEGAIADVVAGKSEPAPAYRHLQRHFDPISLDDLEALGKAGRAAGIDLLLLAQPRALSPAELVALDRWVRGGGRALILADPALDWPSSLPLGDGRRPLFTSMLSPLLAHWGLELVLPTDEAEARVERELDGGTLVTTAPGELRPVASAAGSDLGAKESEDARCRITDRGFRADCAIGAGRAVIWADADFLHPRFWEESPPVLPWLGEKGNMALLTEELRALAAAREAQGSKKGGDKNNTLKQ